MDKLKNIRVTFERRIEGYAIGSIVVKARNVDDAENEAETALMQGKVNFRVREIEYPDGAYIKR